MSNISVAAIRRFHLLLWWVTIAALMGFGCDRSVAQAAAAGAAVETLWAEATQAQQQQQYLRAASLYQKILAMQPNLTEAEMNLGLMLHLAGNPREAVAAFDRVLTRQPNLFAANFLAGMDCLKLDNPARALPHLEKATREKPDQIEARVGLANSYLQLAKYPEALEQFTRATEQNSKAADAWYGLGATYLSMEKQAERDLRHSSSPFRAALLGESYLQQGQTEKAVATFSAMVDRQSPVPCAHAMLGLALLRSSRLDDAERQFQLDWNSGTGEGCLLARLGLAALAAGRGDADGSLRQLRAAEEADPGFPRANTDWFLGDVTKAGIEGSARQILDSNPPSRSDSMKALSARNLMKKGHYAACGEALAKASALGIEDLRVQSLCAYYGRRDALVLQATDRILKQSPADPEALYWRVQSLERAGLAALTQGSDVNPESASLHALMGDMLRAKGDLSGAAEEYRKAITAKPDFLTARLGLARALYSDHKPDEAERELKYVFDVNPNDPEANYLMGEVLVNREAYGEALPYLQKALHAEAEELPYVHADLSRVYDEAGDLAQAIAELKQAVSIDVDGSYYYRLGHLYMKAGDRASAAAALDQAAKLRHATDEASLFKK